MTTTTNIKAKFAGTCSCCGKPINVGDLISWGKGRDAVHAGDCARKLGRDKRPMGRAASRLTATPDAFRAARIAAILRSETAEERAAIDAAKTVEELEAIGAGR